LANKAASAKAPVKKAAANAAGTPSSAKAGPAKKEAGKKAAGKKAVPAKKEAVKAPPKAAEKAVPKLSLRSIELKAPPRPPAKPKKAIASPVKPHTAEKLRVLLLEERERHVRQAEELQAEADALAIEREPGDTQFDEESGEGDTLTVERERDLALSATARQIVEEIDQALVRMDNGTYGVCDVCGDKIAIARLEAIPYAQLCINCKARGERRR
jgi:RNA polymerase-binding protein DksA